MTLEELIEKHPLPWKLKVYSNGHTGYVDSTGKPIGLEKALTAINLMGDWSIGCPFCGDSR